MTIDDSRINVLTNYSSSSKNNKVVKSDHNVLVCDVDVRWKPIENKSNRIEIFNLKDIEGLKKFKELTSDSKLVNIFDSKEDFLTQSNKWFKTIMNIIKRSF